MKSKNYIFAFTLATTCVSTSVQAQPTVPKNQTIVVGLQGYSPVSYLDNHRAEIGSPGIAHEYDGVTYFFTTDEQRQRFAADPQKYLPAYGGYCAFGCSVNGKFTPDPTSFKIIAGQTHLFLKSDELDTKPLWEKENLAVIKGKADRSWATQMQSRAYSSARNLPASGLAIQGYSPVSYFTKGRAELGDPRFQVEHNGAIYQLTSAEQVKQFTENPSRYEPAYGGWCAFGMSVQDKFPIDPTRFKIVGDRLLLFLNNSQIDARIEWNKGTEQELLNKAGSHWQKISQ